MTTARTPSDGASGDTPRTDAAECYSNDEHVPWTVVSADFARALERELVAAREEILSVQLDLYRRHTRQLANCARVIERLERERDASRAGAGALLLEACRASEDRKRLFVALCTFIRAHEAFTAAVKPGVIDDPLSDAYDDARAAIRHLIDSPCQWPACSCLPDERCPT